MPDINTPAQFKNALFYWEGHKEAAITKKHVLCSRVYCVFTAWNSLRYSNPDSLLCNIFAPELKLLESCVGANKQSHLAYQLCLNCSILYKMNIMRSSFSTNYTSKRRFCCCFACYFFVSTERNFPAKLLSSLLQCFCPSTVLARIICYNKLTWDLQVHVTMLKKAKQATFQPFCSSVWRQFLHAFLISTLLHFRSSSHFTPKIERRKAQLSVPFAVNKTCFGHLNTTAQLFFWAKLLPTRNDLSQIYLMSAFIICNITLLTCF